jgi:hypothetical protein
VLAGFLLVLFADTRSLVLDSSGARDLSPLSKLLDCARAKCPQGLLGPDGLYVADADWRDTSTACLPDPASIFDPYFSDYTGRIVKQALPKTVVADRLPQLWTIQTALGVSDIAFVGNTPTRSYLQAALGFSRMSHRVVRVNSNGT